MKFAQLAALAGLALIAISLFSLGLPTPKIKSEYDLTVDTTYDHPLEIRSPIRYQVHEVDGVKVYHHGAQLYIDVRKERPPAAGVTAVTIEEGLPKAAGAAAVKEVAQEENPPSHLDHHPEEPSHHPAAASAREEGTSNQSLSAADAPPAWLVKTKTGPADVLKVDNHVIEVINTQTRAKLSALSSGFKYLLPQKEAEGIDTTKVRKIWIDVGARFYTKGSTSWFSKRYPNASQFEAYLFDVLDQASGYTPATRKWFKHFEFNVQAVWTHDDGVEIKGMKMPVVKFEEKKVASDTRQVWKIKSLNLARWVKENFKPEDFIVMKFDIEGGEWAVLPFLQKEGVLGNYIDEMFFECHPRHALAFGRYIPQECIDFTNWARDQGVHCHRWT